MPLNSISGNVLYRFLLPFFHVVTKLNDWLNNLRMDLTKAAIVPCSLPFLKSTFQTLPFCTQIHSVCVRHLWSRIKLCGLWIIIYAIDLGSNIWIGNQDNLRRKGFLNILAWVGRSVSVICEKSVPFNRIKCSNPILDNTYLFKIHSFKKVNPSILVCLNFSSVILVVSTHSLNLSWFSGGVSLKIRRDE